MKKILSLSVLALAAAAAPAQAATSQSVEVAVDATLDNFCFFDTGNDSLTLSNTARDDSTVVQYECNFIGSPTLKVQSLRGGLYPDSTAVSNGASIASPVVYKVAFGNSVTTASSGTDSSAITTAAIVAGTNATTAANTATDATLALNLSNLLQYAGSYSDTLTVTIAP